MHVIRVILVMLLSITLVRSAVNALQGNLNIMLVMIHAQFVMIM